MTEEETIAAVRAHFGDPDRLVIKLKSGNFAAYQVWDFVVFTPDGKPVAPPEVSIEDFLDAAFLFMELDENEDEEQDS